MRKYFSYCCFLFLACLSCSKELPLPEVKKDRKISLLGELVAGEPIYFRAGQSIPVSSSSSLKFEVLKGLSVTVKDALGLSVVLNGMEDSLTPYLYTIPYSAPNKIEAGRSYTVSASHAELGVAEITVPIPVPFSATILDTAGTIYASDSALAIDVQIHDAAGDSYFVIEALKQRMAIKGFFYLNGEWLDMSVYKDRYDSLIFVNYPVQQKFDTTFQPGFQRQNLYTSDVNTENLRDHSSFNIFRRVLLTDFKFQGSDYTTRIYLSRSRNTGFLDTTDQRGRIILQVKSVSKDYFDYLKTYELYDPLVGFSSFTPPADVKGNVKNGMGVVGGVYRLQFFYVFDEWDF